MPVCELCGGTTFVKRDGMFVCEGCGTKYTLDEAQKLQAAEQAVKQEPDAAERPTVGSVVGGVAAAAIGALLEALKSAEDFQPEQAAAEQDACSVNNYICQGWQMVVDDYRKREHPTKPQLDKVVAQAKECMMALDNAARFEPEKYVQNSIMLGNAAEIAKSVKDLKCYERKDGEWKRVSLPVSSSDIKIPGQKDSWEDMRKVHVAKIEQEYLDAHPEDVQHRADLQTQQAAIREQLGELKDEKKSKGFFNFSEKREVKERMAPVKDQLAQTQKQLRDLDRAVEAYVEERLDDLSTTFMRLDF